MIELQNISKTFRKGSEEVHAVEKIDLSIEPHSIVALIGPSGCGKSTLLNMIAGLYPPSGGKIYYDGELVTTVNTHAGYMTQKDNLLPWRNVIDNVSLPLEINGVGKEERYEKTRGMLAQVGLDGFENKYSSELSGGMRKRACLARMLLYEPQALLLDEPFAALDAQLRLAMHDLLLKLWTEKRQTILLVTHDLVEAVTLADRVVVFSKRPATVTYDEVVDIPRPRDVREVRFTERFREIYNSVWDHLKDQYDEGRI
jgi:NitT/TauT family transport system ATP-binding protein